MSTPSAPAPEPAPRAEDLKPYAARIVRVVEGQHIISTNRLATSSKDQALLEALVEEVKPALPPAARGLHFLLATPFRYGWPRPSRFRRAGERPGIFYASEGIATAIAETAYWRMLAFSRSPGMRLPETTTEYTSFSIAARTERAVDLTRSPFLEFEPVWMSNDYACCQRLAASARGIGTEAIRYRSARDAAGGANLALLDPAAFAEPAPRIEESWHLRFVGERLTALAAFPSSLSFSFAFSQFGLAPP